MAFCFQHFKQLSKKTKAEIPNLSPAATRLAYAIESSIKRRFSHVFDSTEAIIVAHASPKFKVKWVDLQEKKDAYKQMIIDELRALESVTVTEEDDTSGLNTTQHNEKKGIFTGSILMMMNKQKMMLRMRLSSTSRMQKVLIA